MEKIYILDTNVLIQAPYAVECFEENEVVLPIVSYRITCNNGNQRTLINP